MAENKDNHTENANHASTEEELNKLDAVRDLLFGQNVQEYRNEIKELKQEIEKSQKSLTNRVDDSEKQFSDQLAELNKKVDARFNEIESQLKQLSDTKVDKDVIAEAFSAMAKSIQSK